MKRRNLALSSLILSQALTQVTTPAMAIWEPTNPVTLSSSALSINGRAFNLTLVLDSPGDEQIHLQGQAFLTEKEKDTALIIGASDDGNMLFERVSSENGKDTYAGTACTSSFNHCDELKNGEKFELVYNRQEKSWEVSLNTTFTETNEEDQEVQVNIENLTLSSKGA